MRLLWAWLISCNSQPLPLFRFSSELQLTKVSSSLYVFQSSVMADSAPANGQWVWDEAAGELVFQR